MKRLPLMIVSLLVLIVGGCAENIVTPEEVFQTFALEWEQGDYAAMYESLSSHSKELISADEFIELHTTTYTEIEASDLSIILISPEKEENEKIEGSEVTLQYEKNLSMFTGDIKLDSAVSLVLDEEKNEWLIDWNPEFIFPMMEVGDRVKLRTLYPSERGEIFDRHNQELAVNGTIYEIGVVLGRVENEEEEIKQLSKQINVSEEFIREKLAQSWVGPDTFVPIKNVSLDQQTFVEELYETIPFATYREAKARVYPAGKASAHLIGYIGLVSEKDIEEDTERAYQSNSKIGRAGLERLFEKRLRGQSGGEIFIESAEGKEKHVVQRKEAINGETIQLTIDRTLQEAVFNKFNREGDSGVGVAVHPVTGEVLTLVSSPAYDPNEFILGMSPTEYSQLENNPQRPLTNRFAQAFIPGSTIKPITAAIALKNGLDPNQKIASSNDGWRKEGSWGNHSVRRVPNPLEQLNLTEAMMYSDNIYFAKIAVELGIDDFEHGLMEFGFKDSIPFAYPFTESQIATEKVDTEILLADTAYGQGELLVNPLHLAMLYSTFLNDGSIPRPLLLSTEQAEWWLDEVITKEHSDIVLESLIEVIENPNGTASDVRLDQVKLAGKTGTAEHKLSREHDEGSETGWFVAMDTDDRDLLMLMMIEDIETGSAYVAHKVKELFQEYDTNE